ncbi:MAG: SAM hydroxide adenosyltransferase [Thermodesulfobacteriota bacterium]
MSRGEKSLKLGEEIKDIRIAEWGNPVVKDNRLEGIIIHIDRFGNLITNISQQDILFFSKGGAIVIRVGKVEIIKFSSTYSEGEIGKPIALIGSTNLLEIATYMENAHKIFKVNRFEPVIVEKIL